MVPGAMAHFYVNHVVRRLFLWGGLVGCTYREVFQIKIYDYRNVRLRNVKMTI